ncbi:MAG: hypothetical protein RQ751_06200 [Longimicrobiales bacterium]|nr:hypothetical protein [Longimicrobiales bacterium]
MRADSHTPPLSPGPSPRSARVALALERPTVSGVVTAAASVLALGAATVFFLVPTLFYVLPVPEGVDAVTLCVPGLGPLHHVSDGLSPEQEELTWVHEAVHAEQCRSFGALWYARQAVSARGRLTLEARALCAEAVLLVRRGGDPDRLLVHTENVLYAEYLDGSGIDRPAVAHAVRAACGPLIPE